MTLSADFTNQVSNTMGFIEFTHDAVVMVAKQAGKLCWEGLELLLACGSFRRLFTFSLCLLVAIMGGCVPS